MAAPTSWRHMPRLVSRHSASLLYRVPPRLPCRAPHLAAFPRRFFQTDAPPPPRLSNFAFAFDIDGVLLRSSDPLPRAHTALSYLQSQSVPFILLTNGGGVHESERVADLSGKLGIPLDTAQFIQSHTPFQEMHEFKERTVLVVGGDGDKCRRVAEAYGFKNVVVPGDILVHDPHVWPFSRHLLDYYKRFARPLPQPKLKIDAIFVYHDSRDWGLDCQIILDLLLSQNGVLGTVSARNGDRNLPNKGFQQDGQPPLYFSNPDLIWAAGYPLSRIGQGGFQAALSGLWTELTGGPGHAAELHKIVMGKPHQPTYAAAEKRLIRYRKRIMGKSAADQEHLQRVYMVGDNPASDILGGNNYRSPHGTDWASILVQTGVYKEGTEPAHKPRKIVGDVLDAVSWAVAQEGWGPPPEKTSEGR